MPGKILGLEISESHVTAVQLKSGLKGYEISACARIPLKGNESFGDALKELSIRMDLRSDSCIASIPPAVLSYRNLQMPFKEKKKIVQTLPFEIEPVIPFPIEDLSFDFVVTEGDEQNKIVAASVKNEIISSYLAHFNNYGIDPNVLEISGVPLISWLLKQPETPDDFILLYLQEKSACLIFTLKRRINLIRAFSFNGKRFVEACSRPSDHVKKGFNSEDLKAVCRKVRITLNANIWGDADISPPEKAYIAGLGSDFPELDDFFEMYLDMPVKLVDVGTDPKVGISEDVRERWDHPLMDGALALALRDGKRDQGFNFRKGEFEVKKHYAGLKRQFKRASVFLFIIAALLVVDFGVDYYFLEKRYKRLGQEMTDIFKSTFPEINRIVDPLQQMKVKVRELNGASDQEFSPYGDANVLDLLKDISVRLPKSLTIIITSMTIDDEAIRMSGKTDNFNNVDAVKGALRQSEFFDSVAISAANLDRSGKQVQFELKLRRVRGKNTG